MAATKQKVELNTENKWNWAKGIILSFILALLLDIGHSGAGIKKTQIEDHKALQELESKTDERFERIDKQHEYIIQKLDKLIDEKRK